MKRPSTRRDLLRSGLLVPAGLLLDAAVPRALLAGPVLVPTPPCEDADDPTPLLGPGPFFKPRSPRRMSLLEPGLEGTQVRITGRVLGTGCRPVPGALLDLWHADAEGAYDMKGYRLRGHQFSDEDGRYAFETVLPGNYGSRTRHFHFRLQAPHRPILSTQLFFPGEARNERDFLYRPELLVSLEPAADPPEARFDFVLDLG